MRAGHAFSRRLLSLCLMLGLQVHRAGSHEGQGGCNIRYRHELETLISFLVTFDFDGMGGRQKPGPCIILL